MKGKSSMNDINNALINHELHKNNYEHEAEREMGCCASVRVVFCIPQSPALLPGSGGGGAFGASSGGIAFLRTKVENLPKFSSCLFYRCMCSERFSCMLHPLERCIFSAEKHTYFILRFLSVQLLVLVQQVTRSRTRQTHATPYKIRRTHNLSFLPRPTLLVLRSPERPRP